jgi:hypothetical protein
VTIVLTTLLCVGCGDPKRDNPLDQRACESKCGEREMCRGGACVKDPCPDRMVHVQKNTNAITNIKTDFCISGMEASKQKGPPAASLKAGNDPWVGVLPGEAWAACRAAGYTLCSQDQWDRACNGLSDNGKVENTPPPEKCKSSVLHKTGELAGCEGGFTGLFDMLGNASEWISATKSSENFTNAHGMAGGSYEDGDLSCNSAWTEWSPDKVPKATGFRCCLPCDKSGETCTTGPEWFMYAVLGTQGGRRSGYNMGNAQDMWGASATAGWMLVGNQVARYDGHTWKIDPDFGGVSQVTAISGLPQGDVWVAADSTVYRHNGKSWKELSDGKTTLGFVQDVHPRTATEVYVVVDPTSLPSGSHTVFKWDGKVWTPVGSFSDYAKAVWVDNNTGEIWIAGDNGMIARWGHDPKDKVWKWVKQRTVSGQELRDIQGTSGKDIWAVGQDSQGGMGNSALVLRYDGAKWQPVDSKGPTNSGLTKVVALPDGQVWVSGDRVASRDKAGKWTWYPSDISGAVWVPDANQPDQVWVGHLRRF